MELKTASSVIKYIAKIETDSADYYNRCAGRSDDCKDLYSSLAKENKKFGKRIKKVYYSSVTDALETNFSFQGLYTALDVADYDTALSVIDQVKLCLQLEENIQTFYNQAADLSKGLLDDVNRVFKRIAAARETRKEALHSRLDG